MAVRRLEAKVRTHARSSPRRTVVHVVVVLVIRPLGRLVVPLAPRGRILDTPVDGPVALIGRRAARPSVDKRPLDLDGPRGLVPSHDLHVAARVPLVAPKHEHEPVGICSMLHKGVSLSRVRLVGVVKVKDVVTGREVGHAQLEAPLLVTLPPKPVFHVGLCERDGRGRCEWVGCGVVVEWVGVQRRWRRR